MEANQEAETEIRDDLISLIIPVYNAEKYLPHFLESLERQTYNNIEAIFCYDTKSKDKSLQLLQSFQEKCGNAIKVIIDIGTDAGCGAARDRGFPLSTGKYVAFIDADDYILPGYLEQLHNAFVLHPEINISSCRCKMFMFGNDIKEIEKSLPQNDKVFNIYDNLEMISYYLHMSFIVPDSNKVIQLPVVWLYLIKRDFLVRTGIQNKDAPVLLEDFKWVLELFLHADKIAHTSNILYLYCIHENSNVTSANPKTMLECLNIVTSMIGKDIDAINPDYSKALRNMFIPFLALRSTLVYSYEEWSQFICDMYSLSPGKDETDNTLQSLQMVSSSNPIPPGELLYMKIFNENKFGYYLFCRDIDICKDICKNPVHNNDEMKILQKIKEKYQSEIETFLNTR